MSESQQAGPRIAVVGGGISGLTAAHRLTKLLPSAQVKLYEASDRLGGVLHTHLSDGMIFELGADSFLAKTPRVLELCEELGIDNELIPTNSENRRAFVVRDGRLHAVPEGFVVIRPHSFLKMLRSPLLSWRAKFRAMLEPWVPRHARINEAGHDESVAEFATRRLGKECFERLVQPLLAGIYTADPYQLSLAATMPDAIEDERKHGSLYRAAVKRKQSSEAVSSGARYGSFMSFREGLGTLINSLATQLNPERIHNKSLIDRIIQNSEGQWQLCLASGSTTTYDGLIVALPAPRAAEVLREVDGALSADLGKIPYASSAVVSLVYPKSQVSRLPDGFGIVVPTVEHRQIVAASFTSSKFPHRVPEDHAVVRVFLGGALAPKQMELADEELQAIAEAEMRELIGAEGEPARIDVVRWVEKMPQYHLGHVPRVEQIESRVAKLPRLELAGNAYHGVGIPQCVQSGEEAARRLAGHWQEA